MRAPASQHAWEFLLLCGDASLYKTVTVAVHAFGGALNYTSDRDSALAYITRRKLDGIFVDMKVHGALELLRAIRRGNSNRHSVVFACAEPGDESNPVLRSVANFVLPKPLAAFEVKETLEAARHLMDAERRRYLRYPVMLPVVIKRREQEHKAMTANISRGGMAVRCHDSFEPGASVQFILELPTHQPLQGRGEVAWSNRDGEMGIKFYLMGDEVKQSLFNWMEKRGTAGQA